MSYESNSTLQNWLLRWQLLPTYIIYTLFLVDMGLQHVPFCSRLPVMWDFQHPPLFRGDHNLCGFSNTYKKDNTIAVMQMLNCQKTQYITVLSNSYMGGKMPWLISYKLYYFVYLQILLAVWSEHFQDTTNALVLQMLL